MRLAVLPGDGIGPEITDATVRVLHCVSDLHGLSIDIMRLPVGLRALSEHGTTFPESSRELAASADGIVLGPLSTYQYPPPQAGGINASAELRSSLNLFANIRPSRRRAVPAKAKGMDLVIVRENTEGFYAARSMFAGSGEFMPTPDLAFAVRKISSEASKSVARVSFELARARRRRVTVIHKANVLRLSDGLFLKSVQEVGQQYPDVETDAILVDAMAAFLVRDASRFDVVLTTNLFGDVLSNEAAELAGGLGLAPSLNIGDQHALAQASHGSAPDLAGLDLANPTALILSAGQLLTWLGNKHGDVRFLDAAAAIERGVDLLLQNPATRTADVGGQCGTKAFADHLVDILDARPDVRALG
jgi:isocitrate dehydrogenase (NAD+)